MSFKFYNWQALIADFMKFCWQNPYEDFLNSIQYAFFWVIPRRLNFICQRFGTLCLFHLHRRVGTYPPMKMEKNVPKRWHIKFRRRGITQTNSYNIQNTAKV